MENVDAPSPLSNPQNVGHVHSRAEAAREGPTDGQELEGAVPEYVSGHDEAGQLWGPRTGKQVHGCEEARADDGPPDPEPAVGAMRVGGVARDHARPAPENTVGEWLVDRAQQDRCHQ